MRISDILNEMIVRSGDPHNIPDHSMVIAHRGNIWIISANPEERSTDEMAEIQRMTGINPSWDSSQMADYRPDILVGHIGGKYLFLDSESQQGSISNPLLRKVLHALHLNGVYSEYMNNDGETYEKGELKSSIVGKIPDIVYHGTTLQHIPRILRVGLRPNTHKNWAAIKFNDRIFLSAKYDDAVFHAYRGASMCQCPPVIIATRIPDRSKIDLDYDVASKFYGRGSRAQNSGYLNTMTKFQNHDFHKKRIDTIAQYSPKTDFTKAAGIFAYKGAITPPSFVFFDTSFEDDFYSGNDLIYNLTDSGYLPRRYYSIADFKRAIDEFENDRNPEEDDEEDY